mmetsp:Transcript_18961/g.35751  ORF Transcript_18961/g.35751 Transcript_18961/m.35751 type:complete len:148 (-) Transcript_18961:134-577(-)
MWYQEHSTQYVSAWIALDKMTKQNGSLVVLPLTEGKTEPSGPPDPGQDQSQNSVTIECEAGDCVVFSDTLWHCSGPNRSEDERRVAYAQYTSSPLCGPKSTLPLRFAVPCVLETPQDDEAKQNKSLQSCVTQPAMRRKCQGSIVQAT